MDDVFAAIIVIIAITASLVNASKKNKGTQAKRKAPSPARALEMQDDRQAALEARRRHLQALEEKRRQLHAQGIPIKARSQQPAMTPQVSASTQSAHPTMAPRVHVTPHTKDMFAGSLNAETGEGEDPCHEPELQPQVEPCMLAPQNPPPAPSARPAFSPNDMVRAVVMSEILTRPCDRRCR